MKFLVHYIVRSPVKDRNFDFVWDGPVSARDLNDLRGRLADNASGKTKQIIGADEIIIAGIFPIPDHGSQGANSTAGVRESTSRTREAGDSVGETEGTIEQRGGS